MHSLASPLPYTPWLVLQNARSNPGIPARTRASRHFPSPGLPFGPLLTIPGRFQALFTPLLGVLFSFPSRYYCAIGLGTYLVLGVDDPQLPARIPTRGTQDTPPCNRGTYAYGAITLYGAAFQRTSASYHGIRQGPATPHPPRVTARCSVWTLPLSVAPTHGIAFAFFSCGYSDVSFPRVPAPSRERPRRDRISHSGIPGSKAPCASPGLFAAWHTLRRRPSRAIHRPGYSPETPVPVCIPEQTSARPHIA